MDEFKQQVKKGFTACKSDIESLQEENVLLRNDITSLKEQNNKLQEQINDLVGEIKGLNVALEHIKDMTVKVAASTPQPQETAVAPVAEPIVQEKVVVKEQKSQDPYEALLAFKAKSNKKELLKQKMLSMIGDHGMNLSELKFMFVEHFRYTSKATFYNYLKELELEKFLIVQREQSKNYVYLANSIKNTL